MLLLKKHLVKLVRDGKKRQTLRFWTRPIVTVGQVSFTPGLGRMLITGVEVIHDMNELTDADALADGFNNLAELMAELRRIYPRIPPVGKKLYRIAFEWPVPDKHPLAASSVVAPGIRKKEQPSTHQPSSRPCADTTGDRLKHARKSKTARSPTAVEMTQLRDWILNQRGHL